MIAGGTELCGYSFTYQAFLEGEEIVDFYGTNNKETNITFDAEDRNFTFASVAQK